MRTRQEVIEELSKAIERRKEADDAINSLNEELKGFDEIPALPTYPEGDTYYRVSNEFEAIPYEVTNTDYVHWNMFPTREYAEMFIRHAILLSKMLHCKWYLDRDYKPDWNNYDEKFTVWYNHADSKWTIDANEIHEMLSIYFRTEEVAQKCADWLNERTLDEMEERK